MDILERNLTDTSDRYQATIQAIKTITEVAKESVKNKVVEIDSSYSQEMLSDLSELIQSLDAVNQAKLNDIIQQASLEKKGIDYVITQLKKVIIPPDIPTEVSFIPPTGYWDDDNEYVKAMQCLDLFGTISPSQEQVLAYEQRIALSIRREKHIKELKASLTLSMINLSRTLINSVKLLGTYLNKNKDASI